MEGYGSFANEDPNGLPLQMFLRFAALQTNKQTNKKVFPNCSFKDVAMCQVKKRLCPPRTQFKIFPHPSEDLRVQHAGRTKESVQSPEIHLKCPDESLGLEGGRGYKEDAAQASFRESTMEFPGSYLKRSLSSGPGKAI